MKKLILFILSFTIILSAQQREKIVLDLNRAIELALEKNSEIKVAQMEVNKSKEKLREALSGLYPKLDLSAQYQRYIKKPVIFLPPGTPFSPGNKPGILEIGSDNSYNGSASLSVPLFAWSLYESIGVASNSLDLSTESYRNTKVQIIGNVKKSFLAVLLSREMKNLMELSLKNAEDNFENIKRLNKAGTLSDYDVLRAEVQVENLKPTVLQMENNYKLSLEALKVAIGLDASEDVDVVGELNFEEPYQLPSEDEIIRELLQTNPQLSILEQQVKLYEKMVSLEKSSYLPTLAGFGSYQYQTQANDFNFSEYRWVKTFVVGLQIQLPVFNGFRTQSRVSQAEISLSQAKEQKRNLTEAIKTQALSILYRVQQALKRIEGQNKTVKQAEEGYNIAKRRLENGLATQLEVNDAELALRQARINRLQAIYDLKVAEAELNTVLGKN
ncbi:MAG: TolC family protein [Melioribacter sp.]|uniref:TolC family protein n=1 Tax=Rosettibacter primus TaxID=3111523 RepID=UPI00247DB839|nr:TolC family protein [Melioribacter sp.]